LALGRTFNFALGRMVTVIVIACPHDPRDVVAIVDLVRATYRKMVQNLWWATGYNVVAIPRPLPPGRGQRSSEAQAGPRADRR
jgi:cation transport ATPase